MAKEAPIRSPAGEDERPERARHSAGYALIEMVAALAVIMLLIGMVLPMVPLTTTPSRLLALVSSSVSLLRDARTAALRSAKPVAARFDAARRTLRAGVGVVAIPPDVGFSLTTGGNCPSGDRSGEILFRPDGTNCGGLLRFSKGAQVLRARVNWLDGHIDVAAGG